VLADDGLSEGADAKRRQLILVRTKAPAKEWIAADPAFWKP
jgi:hypothetical protein